MAVPSPLPRVLAKGEGWLGSGGRCPSDAHRLRWVSPSLWDPGGDGPWQWVMSSRTRPGAGRWWCIFCGGWGGGGEGGRGWPCAAGLGRGAGSELLLAELSFPLSANHICIVWFLCMCGGGSLYFFSEAEAAIFILEFPALLLYRGMCCSCRSAVASLRPSCSGSAARRRQLPPHASRLRARVPSFGHTWVSLGQRC